MDDEEERIDLSNIISVNTTTGKPCPAPTLEDFIVMILRMMWGPRARDERYAFDSLGGLGFAAHRRARRRKLWARALAIADRVGHGEVAEPMILRPDFVAVPLSSVDEVRRIFGETERAVADAVRIPPAYLFGAGPIRRDDPLITPPEIL